MTATVRSVPATASRKSCADRYYEEGCRLVGLATTYWNKAHDLGLDAAQRSGSRLAYEQVSARARSCFKRHDVLLDAIARDAHRGDLMTDDEMDRVRREMDVLHLRRELDVDAAVDMMYVRTLLEEFDQLSGSVAAAVALCRSVQTEAPEFFDVDTLWPSQVLNTLGICRPAAAPEESS